MQPLGLSLKDVQYNPFTKKTSGELMLVHLCRNCGKVSCNRIAGDDNPHSLLSLLGQQSEINGIPLLTVKDKEQVLTAVFGYNHPDI